MFYPEETSSLVQTKKQERCNFIIMPVATYIFISSLATCFSKCLRTLPKKLAFFIKVS